MFLKSYRFIFSIAFSLAFFSCDQVPINEEASGPFGQNIVPSDIPSDVTVTPGVPPTAGPQSPMLPHGLMATQSIRLKAGAALNSDLFVTGNCSGGSGGSGGSGSNGCLSPDNELLVGIGVTNMAEKVMKADTIRVKTKANIQGTLEGNEFNISPLATVANQITPLGELPTSPNFLTGIPGSQDINENDSPLLAGNYKDLKLKSKKSIELLDGFYTFNTVDLGIKSTMTCQGICVVLIKDKFKIKAKSIVRASSDNSNDFTFFVEGINGNNGNIHTFKPNVR